MNRSEIMQMCKAIFIKWALDSVDESLKQDPDYNSQSFVARILRKKMEVFEIPIQIPDCVLILIELCVGGNPGYAQLMLKRLMGTNIEKDHIISTSDFSREFPADFPVIDESEFWEDSFERAWDAQKDENGNNRCDTRDWWMESFIQEGVTKA